MLDVRTFLGTSLVLLTGCGPLFDYCEPGGRGVDGLAPDYEIVLQDDDSRTTPAGVGRYLESFRLRGRFPGENGEGVTIRFAALPVRNASSVEDPQNEQTLEACEYKAILHMTTSIVIDFHDGSPVVLEGWLIISQFSRWSVSAYSVPGECDARLCSQPELGARIGMGLADGRMDIQISEGGVLGTPLGPVTLVPLEILAGNLNEDGGGAMKHVTVEGLGLGRGIFR